MPETFALQFKGLGRLRGQLAALGHGGCSIERLQKLNKAICRLSFCIFMQGLCHLQHRVANEATLCKLCRLPVYEILFGSRKALPGFLFPLVVDFMIQCWFTGICDLLKELPDLLSLYVLWRVDAGPYGSMLDAIVSKAVKKWINFLARVTIPRPQQLDHMLDMNAALTPLMKFGHIFKAVQGNLRGGDSLTYGCFSRYENDLHAQINDNLISSTSRMLDNKLLHGSNEKFLKQAMSMWDHLNKRMVLKYYCKKIRTAEAAPSSMLKIAKSGGMMNFLDYLDEQDCFYVTFADSKVIEYSTKSLLNEEHRREFDFLESHDPDKFCHDFVITCFTGAHLTRIVRHDLGRHFLLEFPRNSIIVSGRNYPAKNKLIKELSETGLVYLHDGFLSPCVNWNECERESRISFVYDCMIQYWIIDVLKREGALDLDPRFACFLFNCIAVMMLDVLTGYTPVSETLEWTLWKHFNVLICDWMELLSRLYQEGRITALQSKILPVLRFCHAMVDIRPDQGVLDHHRIQYCLRTIKSLLADESNRSTQLMDGGCELRFCLRSIQSCLEKLHGRRNERTSDEIIIGDASGYGEGCAVYKVFDHGLKCMVTLKEFSCRRLVSEELLQEVNSMQRLEHPNIVKPYRAIQCNSTLYLTMECYSGDTLMDYIRSQSRVDDLTFRRFTVQILQGLAYLHRNGIMHGELSPTNIMRCVYDIIKLVDFGAIRQLMNAVSDTKQEYSIARMAFMAPETILTGRPTMQSDMWSLGCTLFHLATGIPPWDGNDGPLSLLKAIQSNLAFPLTALETCGLDCHAIKLILSCLKIDPSERPASPVLLLSPFLYEPIPYDKITIQSSW
jgi:hypothetical protein